MAKQKTTAETAFPNEVALTTAIEENSSFASLSASLAEIRKLKGVIGYILRSNDSAIIDVAEYDKILPYALLTSEIHEKSVEIAKQFNLGSTESMLVEGENTKVLCLTLEDNKIDVFMENSSNHAWIIKRILL